ncbi:hypothetical protein EMIHUDRAFT_243837 [Emiliania huxleyi CCMP1516]|uniref:TRUD domain-containing protein n=2 Tax=Emiliania huxleyi TaxID=2903 RepID=A0A0D3J2F3_EMIH1|nr:hypothetical protein EMIHUDRAFT_243837 [Emiliania huxleyi CCMP1516]EOD17688.1 hypothetical protein EMIHUDRAFT_243837 [Emiliania huxleyi CCMP1516]|eukprot:XP_005770117.1 hypothetical protein EMIHUDRAFT_243837 [Emiliania huxleyi CCMP1516]
MRTVTSEASVGITETCTPGPGFRAATKQRYSDFIVNEVRLSGEPVHLASLPAAVAQKAAEEEELPPPAEAVEELAELLGEGPAAAVLRLDTHERDAARARVEARARKRQKGGGRGGGSAGSHRYLEFTLYKENRDTLHAILQLAQSLHVSQNLFTFAGTKDRRAVTAQRVSAFRLPASKIEQLMARKPFGDSLVASDCTNVQAALEGLRTHGFPNYFGLQRFGANVDAATHEVGAALLRADYPQALRQLDEGDAVAALRLLPRRPSVARQLLEGLRDSGSSNVLAALSRLPKNLRSMYLHALQSWVWNHAASERLRRYGCEAAPHVVTAEEAAARTYSIEDVVLPLPGTKVVMPQNELAEVYTELLARQRLEPASFHHKVKEMVMPGAYRRLVQRPRDLSWQYFRYTDPRVPLARTDLARLRGDPEPQGVADGPRLAVVLRFTLPPSTYATMLLRELTKQSTDLTHQLELNQPHVAPTSAEHAKEE